MSLDRDDRSETTSAGKPLLEFGPSGSGVRDTSASAGSAGAGDRDNTSDARSSPYSDIRLSNRASHGDADADGWRAGGFALPPGATGAAAAIFGEWPGSSAASSEMGKYHCGRCGATDCAAGPVVVITNGSFSLRRRKAPRVHLTSLHCLRGRNTKPVCIRGWRAICHLHHRNRLLKWNWPKVVEKRGDLL